MSKSPYLINPNILAHPDRIVHSVELDMEAQETYLAGSPISALGKLANDETAFGILLYDVHKSIGGRVGTVVISGYIQQDVAAEWSGITVSDAAKSAMINVLFTDDGSRAGGVTSWEDLEDKPFYEALEATELVPLTELDISDGTAVLQSVLPFVEGDTYVVEWDGEVYNCVCRADTYSAYGGVAVLALGNHSLFGGTGGNGEPFAIAAITDLGVTGCMVGEADLGTHTMAIHGQSLVVHTIKPEYLPPIPYYNLNDLGIDEIPDGADGTVASVEIHDSDIVKEIQKEMMRGPIVLEFELAEGSVAGGERFRAIGLSSQEFGFNGTELAPHDYYTYRTIVTGSATGRFYLVKVVFGLGYLIKASYEVVNCK